MQTAITNTINNLIQNKDEFIASLKSILEEAVGSTGNTEIHSIEQRMAEIHRLVSTLVDCYTSASERDELIEKKIDELIQEKADLKKRLEDKSKA